MSHTAFIAIGSNLGTPKENCIEAIDIISSNPDIKITSKSSFYQTAPVGNTEQDWFINSVIKISTKLNPDILLSALLKIESKMGRIRKEKWGPRIIDLDLLFYDNLVIKKKDLTLPHPEIQKRNFVLQPLNEIGENFIHPTLQKRISTLLKESKDNSVIKKIN
jgi:dihydroneopterin aldolase / 2-amino-4-hydroxy-6-hydroxymethyldihydropteridine diphosphokinase